MSPTPHPTPQPAPRPEGAQPNERWNNVDHGAEVTAHAMPSGPVNNSVPVGEGQGPVSEEIMTLNPPSLEDIDAPAGQQDAQPGKRSLPVWVWVLLALAVLVTVAAISLRMTGVI